MAVPETISYVPKAKIGFGERQFRETRTSGQLGYDAVFGLVLPVICFLFDPVVFNTRFAREGISSGISQFKTFTYCFSAIAMAALVVSLLWGRRNAKLSAILSGILLAGAAGSCLIGLLILPLSLRGLLVLFIGLLGFIPFFTGFAYLRSGLQSFRQSKPELSPPVRAALIAAGVIIVIGLPVLAHFQMRWAVSRLVDDAIRVDTKAVQADVNRMRYVAWAADLDPLLQAYAAQPEAAQQALADSYSALAGEGIRVRLGLVRD